MENLVAAAVRRLAHRAGHAQPPAEPRPVTLNGVATLTTNRSDLPGPYSRPIAVDLLVDDVRGTVTVTGLDIAPAKVGSVTCRLTQVPGSGSGTLRDGLLSVTIDLHLAIDVLRGAQDSTIRLTCTTEGPGRAVDESGGIVVVGSGVFQGGYVGGRAAKIRIEGTITPPPPPRPHAEAPRRAVVSA